ncbi:MAG: aldose 1-epimerase family protein [Winogradskyella sp.]|uniref:aldose 1-epimerase family protein n=1 Tax=Winogradskyella sp. TaxID=1883156 RepID=UPI0018303DA1|nr:aldose 1-epimerase family protein [Winogradskyella sp.]
MPLLKNEWLQINIKPKGAELSNITSVKHDTEFMWQADPAIWGSHAPNLFPIIGALKNDTYNYNGKVYHMPKHGFLRNSSQFSVSYETDTKVTFSLNSNPELYAIYPFLFQFELTYELIENRLLVHHRIQNLDDKALYFSVGGHPAFKCPLFKNEAYTDYYLEFEKPEKSESYILNMNTGLVTDQTKPVFNENKILLRPDLFKEDALIFKDLKSKKVTLKHKTNGAILTVSFDDFPFLGIWAKPNAPYVCIEPWLGIADSESTSQQLIEKEGIIELATNSTFKASYAIVIDNALLV